MWPYVRVQPQTRLQYNGLSIPSGVIEPINKQISRIVSMKTFSSSSSSFIIVSFVSWEKRICEVRRKRISAVAAWASGNGIPLSSFLFPEKKKRKNQKNKNKKQKTKNKKQKTKNKKQKTKNKEKQRKTKNKEKQKKNKKRKERKSEHVAKRMSRFQKKKSSLFLFIFKNKNKNRKLFQKKKEIIFSKNNKETKIRFCFFEQQFFERK